MSPKCEIRTVPDSKKYECRDFAKAIESGYRRNRLNIVPLSNINGTNLGNFVRARRRELGISQTELARRVGVDDAYISAIERGIRTPDGVVFIDQLGAALALDVDGRLELATVAACSQRYIHLSDPLALCVASPCLYSSISSRDSGE